MNIKIQCILWWCNFSLLVIKELVIFWDKGYAFIGS